MAWIRHKRSLLLTCCLILSGLSIYTSMYDQSRSDQNKGYFNEEYLADRSKDTNKQSNPDYKHREDGVREMKRRPDMKIRGNMETHEVKENSKLIYSGADKKKNHIQPVGDVNVVKLDKDTRRDPQLKVRQVKSVYNIPNFNSPEQRKDADLVLNTGVQGTFVNVDSTQFLRGDLAPNTVHYIWCGRRVFEFKHYLSVLSVIKLVQPDMIILHYDHKPEVDIKRYNQWIWELTHEYPFLTFRNLREHSRICHDPKMQDKYVYDIINRQGGIYMDEHTILSEFPFKFRQYDLFSSLMSQGGFLVSKPGVLRGRPIEDTLKDQRLNAGHSPCATYTEFASNSMRYSCVVNFATFYPKDIWNLHNSFGRLARKLMYDTEVLPSPQPSYESLVPNIAHMVWMGGGKMDFLFYLSVLSVLNVLKVETLYIHGDKPPTGRYWQMLKDNPRIIHIHREKPETIYQNEVRSPQHISDIVRVDIMVKYGGIYCDVDTIWVQSLNPVLRGYDAVASYDWVYWDPPYPDIINFGVTLGKRGATFWHLFQRSMQYFRKESWGFNGLRQPYKVYEKYPGLLKIDEHLQVICFNFMCHPTWNKNYHNESVNHVNTPFNWRTDTYAFHWTDPVPMELRNQKELSKSKTIFAEIGRYVLQQSGLL